MSAFSCIRTGAAILALLFLAACQETEEAAAPPAPPPPSQVGIVTVEPESIAVVSDLPGRISPTRIAEVRPRVGGIIVERIFEQGRDVTAGEPLFRIDPAVFEVQVQSAQAAVARAEAVLLQATQEADRNRQLVASRTVSEANFEAAIAQQRQAEADVAAAQASLQSAQINLDYTTVRAPIDGRIGRAIVTEGALVSPTGAEALATIQQLNPVYADVQQPVSELQRLRQALGSGVLRQVEPDVASVRLSLDDGTEYPYSGRLLFSDATVDPASGQVTLRAEFPNPDGMLLPGLYVRVAIEEGIEEAALAVPNQAIQRDTAGRAQVYVVNAENVVELRPVAVSRALGDRSVVDEGLEPGDRVIAEGFQRIGPGATVTTVDFVPAGTEPQGQGPDVQPVDDQTSAIDDPAASSVETEPEDDVGMAQDTTTGTTPPTPTPRAAAAATSRAE